MKVCTDACLFGALVPSGFIHALDIGTGTGLLPLMLAQKNPQALFDAVEIDTDAAEQAKENIAKSPWAERINILNIDVLAFKADKKYDCIISNPPFFKNDLKSPDAAKNNARHNTSLELFQLLAVVKKNITDDGMFAVLLPFKLINYFIEEAAKLGFNLAHQILVKQTFKHKFFRGILIFTKKEMQFQLQETIIKDPEGSYTTDFAEALKDYYLFL